jgi:hypothetical protein
MTTRSAMALGTAGFSAMLCVDALDRHGIDRSREEFHHRLWITGSSIKNSETTVQVPLKSG